MITLITLNRRKISAITEFALFVAPAFLLILAVTNLPFLMNIFYSFQRWNGLSSQKEFIGLKNFIKLFTDDPLFWQSFLFTLKYLVFYVLFANAIALASAVLLTKKIIGCNLVRSCIYLPNIISLIAVSLIWRFIFGPGFEALHHITGMKIFQLSWFGEKNLAFYVLLITTLWQTIGFYMVIYIAGLTTIPIDINEADQIDGCVGLKNFFKIKLPLIMPALTVCLFFSLTYALKLFDIILTMTHGGPGDSTSTIAYNIYIEAFINSRYGYGTAKSLVFFLVVLVVTAFQNWEGPDYDEKSRRNFNRRGRTWS
jgi:raffinose/stachyose/melibiose transport system permease protein